MAAGPAALLLQREQHLNLWETNPRSTVTRRGEERGEGAVSRWLKQPHQPVQNSPRAACPRPPCHPRTPCPRRPCHPRSVQRPGAGGAPQCGCGCPRTVAMASPLLLRLCWQPAQRPSAREPGRGGTGTTPGATTQGSPGDGLGEAVRRRHRAARAGRHRGHRRRHGKGGKGRAAASASQRAAAGSGRAARPGPEPGARSPEPAAWSPELRARSPEPRRGGGRGRRPPAPGAPQEGSAGRRLLRFGREKPSGGSSPCPKEKGISPVKHLT